MFFFVIVLIDLLLIFVRVRVLNNLYECFVELEKENDKLKQDKQELCDKLKRKEDESKEPASKLQKKDEQPNKVKPLFFFKFHLALNIYNCFSMFRIQVLFVIVKILNQLGKKVVERRFYILILS